MIGGGGHRHHVDENGVDAVDDGAGQGIDVGGAAGEDAAELGAVVEAHGEALEVCEDGLADGTRGPSRRRGGCIPC